MGPGNPNDHPTDAGDACLLSSDELRFFVRGILAFAELFELLAQLAQTEC
jgi:hypothetical protein